VKNGLVIFFVLITSVVSIADWSTTKISLPDLTGYYEEGTEKNADFNCGLTFTEINDIVLVCQGHYTQGILQDVGTLELVPYDTSLEYTMPLDSENWFIEFNPLISGFPIYDFFSPSVSGANWDFMLDGQVEIKSYMTPVTIPAIYSHFKPVRASITDAYLEVFGNCNSIKVQKPNTREFLLAGSTYRIEWYDCRYDYYNIPSYGNYAISFSVDTGENWIPITESPVSNTNYYEWQVPEITAENCLIRIENIDGPLSDISDLSFAIYECSFSPAGDFTGDCYINLSDFQVIASGWLQTSGYTLNDLETLAQNWLNCTNVFDPNCSL